MAMKDEIGPPPSADGVGYQKPPKATQWKKDQSGNPSGKKKSIDVKALVQKANAKKVIVKTANGTLKKVPQGEVVLEKTFIQAINGDVSVQKVLINYAKKYIPEPEKPVPAGHLGFHDITQDDVDYWKAFGCLPAGCSDVLGEISITNLNKAEKAYWKKWKELEATPEGIEERGRILDKLQGPLPPEFLTE